MDHQNFATEQLVQALGVYIETADPRYALTGIQLDTLARCGLSASLYCDEILRRREFISLNMGMSRAVPSVEQRTSVRTVALAICMECHAFELRLLPIVSDPRLLHIQKPLAQRRGYARCVIPIMPRDAGDPWCLVYWQKDECIVFGGAGGGWHRLVVENVKSMFHGTTVRCVFEENSTLEWCMDQAWSLVDRVPRRKRSGMLYQTGWANAEVAATQIMQTHGFVEYVDISLTRKELEEITKDREAIYDQAMNGFSKALETAYPREHSKHSLRT